MTIGKGKCPQSYQNFLYSYGMKRYWVDSTDRLAYTCSMVVDFCTFAGADLLRSEFSSANAATPARRRGGGDYRPWLLIRAPGPHQFATALRTLSLNQKLLQKKRFLALRRINCQGGSCEPRQP
jgi:hypothetical protein